MALTERTEIGKIEVLPMGQIQIRTDSIIEKDGVEISRAYHRHAITPDVSAGDLAKQDQRVKDIAVVAHTAEVKTAWAEHKANLEANR